MLKEPTLYLKYVVAEIYIVFQVFVCIDNGF